MPCQPPPTEAPKMPNKIKERKKLRFAKPLILI